MRNYGWDYKNHRSTSIIHNSMETKHTPGKVKSKRLNSEEEVEGWYVFCRGRHYILEEYNGDGYDERWETSEWIEIAQAPDLLAKVSEQEKEITRLKDWKESEMKLWGPVLDYAQKHGEELGIKLGESISEKILQFLKNRSEQSQCIQQFEEALREAFDVVSGEYFTHPLIDKIKSLLSKLEVPNQS